MTFFERHVTRVVAAGVLLLLIVTVLQNTIFADFTTPVTGTARYHAWHLGIHLGVMMMAVLVPAFRRRLIGFGTASLVTAAYGTVVVASTLINVEPMTKVRLIQSLLVPATILSLGIALPAILEVEDYASIFRGVVMLFVVSAVVSLSVVAAGWTSVYGRMLVIPEDGRGGRLAASGLYTHRNTIGSFLQYIPALIVYLAARTESGLLRARRRWSLWLYASAMATILIHLALTFSRSAQMVAAVSVLPFVVRRPRVGRRFVVCLIGILAGVAILAIVSGPSLDRYLDFSYALHAREGYWIGALSRVPDRPLLGWGLLNLTVDGQTPHNVYLTQLAYFGGMGFILFLGVIAAFARLVYANIATRDRLSLMFVFLVIGVLIQGMVEYIVTFPIFFANSMFWICVGLLARRIEPSRAATP